MPILPILASFFGPPHYLFWLLLLLIILIVIGYFLFLREPESDSDTTPAKPAASDKPAEPAPAPAAPAALPKGAKQDEKLGLIYESAPDNPDDLTKISGVGPKIHQQLNDFGVYKFDQIANWDDAAIAEFGQRLAFKDRIGREGWVEQAKKLAGE